MTPDAETAAALDAADPLAHLRAEFEIPTHHDGSDETYLVGNSLGALPRRARSHVATEIDRWGSSGVRGHFEGPTPWAAYHNDLIDPMADIVGALPAEVTVMNALTVNLHLLLVSFYRPSENRHKILIEGHAFPSDHFAVESQIRQRGFDPAESLVLVEPRHGEETLHVDDILAAITEHGSSLAVILLPGVQYYTGQVLPIAEITRAGHAVGAAVGFDLAHAAGNIPMSLHDDGVDFAAWCTYKYLNSGPGSVAGAYVHERHLTNNDLPKFTGWWGTNPDTRFEMDTVFDPIPTVDSWQPSNSAILGLAAVRGSLEVFAGAGGMAALRTKSEQQIAYFDLLLDAHFSDRIENITPRRMSERGCQFALRVLGETPGRDVFDRLEGAGVACDWRHPDIIRVAPVPLYNTFVDIWRFTEILDSILVDLAAAPAPSSDR
ncbi:MAG: kynureninase [Acidimicrobiales bacterium]